LTGDMSIGVERDHLSATTQVVAWVSKRLETIRGCVSNRAWKLSPSDFAFLWEECKRCFYLKTVMGFQRPRPIMPRIFHVIDSQMKVCFEQTRTEDIAVGIPGGVIAHGDEWVESNRITRKGGSSTCYLRGKFDTVVRFDDGTYGVVDFKTSEAKANQVPRYARQLHAYAYALENPAPRKRGLSPVTRLGLLVFEPARFSHDGDGKASLAGNLTWLEIPRDAAAFLQFIDDVLSVLERHAPPDGTPSCEWCQYRGASRQTGL